MVNFDIGEYLPNVDPGQIFSVMTWFILFIVFALIFGVCLFFFLRWLKFNKRIIIFENVGGRFQPVRNDKAMVFGLGRTGDVVFYLRKNKKYLPVPTIQSGNNTFWYGIKEDGEWINFGIEDINEKMREAGAFFLDKEMRFARVGLQRNLKERYEKLSFMQKYGGLVAYIGLIAITGIMIWLLFDKFIEVSGQVAEMVAASKEVIIETKSVVAALDNVCTGSGLG